VLLCIAHDPGMPLRGHCCIRRSRMAGDWSGDCTPHGLGLAGFRFPPEVISLAVRWYLRYGLSYRDVEELLAERGITVDHVTIYRWVQRFTPEFIEAARPCRHASVTGGSPTRRT
jgi:hypothetical protein